MGNCAGGASDKELKLSKVDTQKYQKAIEESDDPKVQEAMNMVLDERQVGGLTRFEKLAYIVLIQKKFKRLRNIRRAKAIAASNHLRSFSDTLASGEIADHSNKVVQERLAKLGRYQFDNRNVKDLGVEREFRELQLVPEAEGDSKKLYQGQWSVRENLPDGYGAMITEDGSFYEGSFSRGKHHGRGRIIHLDGDYYEGQWKEGKAQGQGKYTYADGAYYEGEWVADQQSGNGREVWPDGAVFEGLYAEGKKNGSGSFQWADGGSYRGNFKDNLMEGTGTYIWADKRQFIGEWHKNKMHGRGVFTWEDGRHYEGEYVDDKKEGHGLFTWADGKKYDGQWKAGKQHGKGQMIIVKEDGTEKARQGIWEDGKRKEWVD